MMLHYYHGGCNMYRINFVYKNGEQATFHYRFYDDLIFDLQNDLYDFVKTCMLFVVDRVGDKDDQ